MVENGIPGGVSITARLAAARVASRARQAAEAAQPGAEAAPAEPPLARRFSPAPKSGGGKGRAPRAQTTVPHDIVVGGTTLVKVVGADRGGDLAPPPPPPLEPDAPDAAEEGAPFGAVVREGAHPADPDLVAGVAGLTDEEKREAGVLINTLDRSAEQQERLTALIERGKLGQGAHPRHAERTAAQATAAARGRAAAPAPARRPAATPGGGAARPPADPGRTLSRTEELIAEMRTIQARLREIEHELARLGQAAS